MSSRMVINRPLVDCFSPEVLSHRGRIVSRALSLNSEGSLQIQAQGSYPGYTSVRVHAQLRRSSPVLKESRTLFGVLTFVPPIHSQGFNRGAECRERLRRDLHCVSCQCGLHRFPNSV